MTINLPSEEQAKAFIELVADYANYIRDMKSPRKLRNEHANLKEYVFVNFVMPGDGSIVLYYEFDSYGELVDVASRVVKFDDLVEWRRSMSYLEYKTYVRFTTPVVPF